MNDELNVENNRGSMKIDVQGGLLSASFTYKEKFEVTDVSRKRKRGSFHPKLSSPS